MYKRLFFLTCLIFIVLTGTAWLGYYAIRLHAEGLEGRRIGQFAAAGENIRREMMRRIEEFVNTEQKRPYTDYQYYYIPEDKTLQQVAVVRSPLAGKLENGLACGYFQIDPFSQITTPYFQGSIPGDDPRAHATALLVDSLRETLIPALNRSFGVDLAGEGVFQGELFENVSNLLANHAQRKIVDTQTEARPADEADESANSHPSRRGKFEINIVKTPQDIQIYTQQRTNIAANEAFNRDQSLPAQVLSDPGRPAAPRGRSVQPESLAPGSAPGGDSQAYWQELSDLQDRLEQLLDSRLHFILSNRYPLPGAPGLRESGMGLLARNSQLAPSQPAAIPARAGKPLDELVQVRQEPFVPLRVEYEDEPGSIFEGQVYLLRHVQVGNDHYLQGFRLNEERLLQMVRQAAEQFTVAGTAPMHYRIDRAETENADYTAVLDFGFGNLLLHLIESDPFWITRQVDRLKLWYFAVIAIMSLVVSLGLTSLWRNVNAQILLARKKDDFISAVSHELRTPLTSLRMYAEMLEKNWVASDEKRHAYYSSMRQESERLSRLIENVLDFSRIQRQNKKYQFKLGDINACVRATVETMRAYAAQAGFDLQATYGAVPALRFDHDAVVQIVINLVDNAIKYARNATDRAILVRTGMHNGYLLIEVEDHGPGVPHNQRKRVFDEFYRCEDESTRQTTGTGLGLALVQRFAQAHNGFVELLTAKPNGALFRVALACEPN